MNKDKLLGISEIKELCLFVCSQLKPSGSRSVDEEALYFGVYWQMSVLLNQKVEMGDKTIGPRITFFKRQIEQLLEKNGFGPNDLLKVIDKIIASVLPEKKVLALSATPGDAFIFL